MLIEFEIAIESAVKEMNDGVKSALTAHVGGKLPVTILRSHFKNICLIRTSSRL